MLESSTTARSRKKVAQEMGGRRTRSSVEDAAGGEPEVCEYEQERQANIAENERRMAALGLLDSAFALQNAARAKKVPRKTPSFKQPVAPPPTRRSSRYVQCAL